MQEYVLDRRSNDAADDMIQELIVEMDICNDAYEELVQTDVMISILDDLVTECVQITCGNLQVFCPVSTHS